MVVGGRCYECFRPSAACFCDWIPRIDNRTEVLMLQHRREYFHRFNTARIVCKALRNSELVADRTPNMAQRLHLKPRAGLLYPGPTAQLITKLSDHQRPQQLIVVDGTWHHAKTLVRDIPALQQLPQYRLAPSSPSRYRIRREPEAISLSTVEATVAALQVLEPETQGFEALLAAFDRMVEVQLAHPGSSQGSRFKARTRRASAVPLALQGNLDNIVVAYGEAPPGAPGRKRVAAPPVVWVAQRLADGACFGCTLATAAPPGESFLRHLELTTTDFAAALSLSTARQRWDQFQRPGDLVVFVHPGSARLFRFLANESTCYLLLNAPHAKAKLQAHMAAESPTLSPQLGRATRRLAAAVAVVRELKNLAASAQ